MAHRQIATKNVFSIQTARVIKPVFEIIVLILVPVLVAFKPFVVLQTIYLSALVQTVTPAMRSQIVIQCHLKMKYLKINVIQIHVQVVRNATMVFVHVCPVYKAIHTDCVGQSVF